MGSHIFLELGEVFNEYTIIEHLYSSDVLSVYKAEVPKANVSSVVLKTFHRVKNTEQFLQKVRNLSKMSHPHIAPLIDYGVFGDFCFIVTPYMVGGNLTSFLSADSVGLTRAVKIVCQVAQAIDYAHSQGFAHRAIKPNNILFDKHGHAMLADFQIESSDARNASDSAAPFADWPYTNSQILNDIQADTYSLAVIFYEMLTQDIPFRNLDGRSSSNTVTDLTKYNPYLPSGLQPVIKRSLLPDLFEPYETATLFADAIIKATANEATGNSEIVWHYQTSQIEGRPFNNGQYLYVYTNRGILLALPHTYKTYRQPALEYQLRARPKRVVGGLTGFRQWVFITTEEGIVYQIDTQTKLEQAHQVGGVLQTTPLIFERNAYVVSSKSDHNNITNCAYEGGRLSIIHITHQEISYLSPQLSSRGIVAQPTIMGNYLYVATRDGQEGGTVYKLPIIGGEPEVFYRSKRSIFSPLIADRNRHLLYIVDIAGNLAFLEPKGKVVWAKKLEISVRNPMFFTDNYLYIGDDYTDKVFQISLDKPKNRWWKTTYDLKLLDRLSARTAKFIGMVSLQSTIFVLYSNGHVVGYSETNNRPIWNWYLPGQFWDGLLAIHPSRIYLWNEQGQIIAIEPSVFQ